MMIATLLVHVCGTTLAGGQVAAAARLAERLSARLVGVAAGFPPPPVTAEFGGMPSYLVQQIMDDIQEGLRVTEAAFRKTAIRLPDALVEWRGAPKPPLDYLCRQARAADVCIVGPAHEKESPLWAIDPADLILTAGRPAILAPDGVKSLDPKSVLIAWKDTPQAWRAVRDSLDLLRRASRVVVCGVGPETSDHALADVTAYLHAHHIDARALRENTRGGAGAALRRIAAEEGAQMIVAGAYGHSRVREWALGGVTRDLIQNVELPCLFAH